MTGLPELLTEMAEEAKSYDGLDRAVRVLRRRHRLARLAPVGIAAVVAVGLVFTYVAVKSEPAAAPDSRTGSLTIPTRSLSWLPETLTVPGTEPPALPTDHGVGLASLIYERAGTPAHESPAPAADPFPAAYLVSVDGGQYRLPSGPYFSLSPDGRWVLSEQGGRLILRDLTGTDTKDLGTSSIGAFAAAWASNTSRLALEQSDGHNQTYDHATVVDLPSGQTHTVGLTNFPLTHICGVQDSGDLILCSSTLVKNQLTASVADGRTGAQRSHLTTDLSAALTAPERASESVNTELALYVRPLAGGTTLLVRTRNYVSTSGVTVADDLLAVDLGDGHVVRRLDLPVQKAGDKVPSAGGVAYAATEGWTVLSALSDGIVIAHTGPRGTGPDAMITTVRGLELLDPVSGQRSAVTTVSGDVSNIVPRGGANRPN